MTAAVLLASLALSLPHHGDQPTLTGFTQATRATETATVCVSPSFWPKLAKDWDEPDASAFWSSPFIVLGPSDCHILRHWRTAWNYGVTNAIQDLGHEMTHAEQQVDGRPSDEHEAECGGVAKWKMLKHRLGITRHLPHPDPIRGC